MKTKLWIVLAAFLLVTGCSANKDKADKKQEVKAEQTAKKKDEKSTETAASDSASADARMEEGLKVCGPLINDTNDILTQAVTVNGDQTAYDYKKLQEGIDKADAAIQCGNNFEGLDGANGTVKFKKTLAAYKSTEKELIAGKNKLETFLKDKNEDTYFDALDHLMKMMENFNQTASTYDEEKNS